MVKFHSKLGDVFEITNTSPKKHLQLVHVDPAQMNSDVVVVFEENPKDYDFYIHTTIEQGLRDGLWHKVSNEEIRVDLGKLAFKTFIDDDEDEDPFWYCWTCADKAPVELNLKKGANFKATDGEVYPASDVLYRINHGKSEFMSDWPS